MDFGTICATTRNVIICNMAVRASQLYRLKDLKAAIHVGNAPPLGAKHFNPSNQPSASSIQGIADIAAAANQAVMQDPLPCVPVIDTTQ